jgi:hypothetical protein
MRQEPPEATLGDKILDFASGRLYYDLCSVSIVLSGEQRQRLSVPPASKQNCGCRRQIPRVALATSFPVRDRDIWRLELESFGSLSFKAAMVAAVQEHNTAKDAMISKNSELPVYSPSLWPQLPHSQVFQAHSADPIKVY